MRKNFGPKTWLYPMPVLILGTYDENGVPNAMNAAWGGIYDYNQVTVSLGKHKTTENFMKTKAFTLAFADSRHVAECDYVGIVSANDVPDKLTRCGFKVTKSEFVNAPIINELPMTLECEVVSFVDGTLVGKIVNVSCLEEYLGEDGLPSVEKIDPITFDSVHAKYIALGKVVGNAFSDGKKIK